jgi:hypothetical protein
VLDRTVPQPPDTEPAVKRAGDLKPGDRIAAGFLPGYDARDVRYVEPYGHHGGRDWALIVHRDGEGLPDVQFLLADTLVPLEVVADRTGLDFSREPEPTETAQVPAGVEGVPHGRDPGRVTVTRYFSFGHGHTDPDTGEDLLNKYVTVLAPTAAACQEAMFASRYGKAWAFGYSPGDPVWQEWGPRWKEHELIDATDGAS